MTKWNLWGQTHGDPRNENIVGSFPSLDSGLPCKKGAGQRVKTQGERALAVEKFARTFAALPFIVGYDWFMWTDCPNMGEAGNDGEDCNYGLVNAADEPYREVVETLFRLNREAERIHAAAILPLAKVNARPSLGRVGGRRIRYPLQSTPQLSPLTN